MCASKVVHNDDSLSLQPHHSSMLSGASTPVIVQEMQGQSDPKNMPKFDGNDLEYLEFKKDCRLRLEKHTTDPLQRAYLLKSPLIITKLEIRNMLSSQTYEEMWQTLDVKYGNIRAIAMKMQKDLKK